MQYFHPQYKVDWRPEVLSRCRDTALRLLEEVGIQVAHDAFLAALKKHDGVRVERNRVFLRHSMADDYFERYLQAQKTVLLGKSTRPMPQDWSLSNDGFSIMVVDVNTDEPREATHQDLRDLIRLLNSFNISGIAFMDTAQEKHQRPPPRGRPAAHSRPGAVSSG